jgi:hypothetical protein
MTPTEVAALIERFSAGRPVTVTVERPPVELPPVDGYRRFTQGRKLTITVEAA